MADFTTTTNLNLKKPAVGGSSDKWGEYLNSDLDTIDTEIQSLKTASTSRSLESLSNVLDLTPTTGQLLQYDTANWKAATVTIPEDIEDLGNVTVSSPADGQVLAYSASNSRWENQTAGAATIPDGTITTAKLSTSLQGQVNLILQTTGTPTDNQILRYNATTTNWEFQDLPGGTISALSDTDVSGISNKDVLVYNSTSGDWVSRPLTIADVTGLQTELDAKLESSDLSVSSLTDTTITTTADNSVLVYDASDSKWKNEGPSTARSSLGLAIGTDVQAYDADTTKNDVSNTFTANQIISVSDNTNAALRITQTGTGNALVVEDSSPDSTPFVVKSTGAVVIGGTDPAAALMTISAGDSGTLNVNSNYNELYIQNSANTGITFSTPNTNLAGLAWADPESNSAAYEYYNHADGGKTAFYESFTRWYTNGTERMRIDSAGNVGIGTTSPNSKLNVSTNSTDAAVTITQTGSGNALVVEDSANPDSSPFVVNASGNVGIGTSSPGEKLDLNGSQRLTGNLIVGTSNAWTTASAWRSIKLTDRHGLQATPGSNAMSISSNSAVGTSGYEYTVTGASAGNYTLSGGTHVFYSAPSGTDGDPVTFSESMRIDSAGNVGIGTNSPSQKLDVSGNINATGALTLGTALAVAEGGTGVTALSSLDVADLGSGSAIDGYVLTADGAGGAAWEAASGGGGGTTAYVEHSSTISDSFTVTSGTNRMYIGGTTFSGTINVAGRLAIVAGPANFTGTINVTGALAIMH